MRSKALAVATVALGATSMIAFGAAADDRHPTGSRFSITGTYEGVVACDDISDGVSSGFTAPVAVTIVEREGGAIDLSLTYEDVNGPETNLYRGAVQSSRRRDAISGFFEGCGGTYASTELARIFPASKRGDGFSFSAESIFQSTSAPGFEGELVVESCKYVLNRTSTAEPDLDTCD